MSQPQGGSRKRNVQEMRIIQMPENPAETQTLPSKERPASMAREAGFEEDEVGDIFQEISLDDIESAKTDIEGVRKLQNDILERIIETKNASQGNEEKNIKDITRGLTPKGTRVLKKYLPRLFDKKISPRPGKPDLEIHSDPRSNSNKEGVKKLLEDAGFDPDSTTQGVLEHEVPLKLSEVIAELKQRQNSEREIGIDKQLKQQEALEMLKDLYALPDKKLTAQELLDQNTENVTERKQTEKEVRLKPFLLKELTENIDKFAKVFYEKYEGDNKKMVDEGRKQNTTVMVQIEKKKNLFESITNYLTKTKEERALEKKRSEELVRLREEQEARLVARRNMGPTFTKEGFLKASRMQDLVDGHFTNFDQLKDALTERIDKNRRQLKTEFSLGPETVEETRKRKRKEESAEKNNPNVENQTSAQTEAKLNAKKKRDEFASRDTDLISELQKADPQEYHLRRLLANTAMLESLLYITDNIGTIAEEKKKNLHSRETKLHKLDEILNQIRDQNPTVELSTVPKKPQSKAA